VEKQKVVKPAELLDEISLCGNRGVNTAIAWVSQTYKTQ
jgi:hypothetical protein